MVITFHASLFQQPLYVDEDGYPINPRKKAQYPTDDLDDRHLYAVSLVEQLNITNEQERKRLDIASGQAGVLCGRVVAYLTAALRQARSTCHLSNSHHMD